MNEPHFSDREFGLFQSLMHRMTGVYLGPAKKSMVFSRLLRRLQLLNLPSFDAYFHRIADGGDPGELQRALDLLTTHETYFFREPRHFAFLADRVLPQLRRGVVFRVWSAASSSGEEAYSLAMVLMDRLGSLVAWEVIGTDISREVVQRAEAGIYGLARINGMPPGYLQRFCRRGIGTRAGTLCIDPALRTRVRFVQANLKGNLDDLGQFDVVFLRNVLIYFDQPTRQDVVRRVAQQLRPGGWFFVGHSETLNGIAGGLQPVLPTIYRKPGRCAA